MKRSVIAALLMLALSGASNAQTINWRSLDDDQRNIMQLSFGYDFGVTAQLGYSRIFHWFRPVSFGLDYSSPMGKVLTDDFKVRLGGQMEIAQIGGLSLTARVQGNLRRYQNQLVRIVGFGSDFAAVAGYYSRTWHAAGEFGFDKAVTSYLKHSDVMKGLFPGIRDGWYVPTGGNYYYGIQAGKTLGETLELSLRMGATSAQFDDENAVLPWYLQLGLGIRF